MNLIRELRDIPYRIKSLWSKLTTDNWYSDHWEIGHTLAYKFLSLTTDKIMKQWYGHPGEFDTQKEWLGVVKEMRFHFFYNIMSGEAGIFWNNEKGREKYRKYLYKHYPFMRDEVDFYWHDMFWNTEQEDWGLGFDTESSETHPGFHSMIFTHKNIKTGEVILSEDFNKVDCFKLFLSGYKDRAEEGGKLFSKYFWNLWD